MFNLNALLKFINVNNDAYIQKSEIQKFLGTQKSPSIFSDYLNSISNDIDNNTFLKDMFNIMQQAKVKNNHPPQLDFKDEDMAYKFQQLNERQEKEDLINIKAEALRLYGVKVENMEKFDTLFNQYIKEAQEKGYQPDYVLTKFNELGFSKPITMEMVKASNNHSIWLQSDLVFEDMDWSNSREVFNYLSFYDKTFSKTSKENLPQGYDPQEVFDKGKSIGLGIDEVHEMGYTGKGVSYAIIDSKTQYDNGQQHKDIHFKEYHVSQYARQQEQIENMHGLAVSYIAQEIVPDADCYYYAQHNGSGMDAPVLDNLKQILEKNKTLPEDNKIRFVSMSMPLYGGEEAQKVVSELEKQGVWVYYSDCAEDGNHGYLSKINPTADANDFNNYQISVGGGEIIITPDGQKHKFIDQNSNTLFVNSGNRTVPDPSSPTAYRHDSRASQSWSVPVLAGYYTLACQADKSMTKEKFLVLANETARTINSTMPVYEAEQIYSSIDERNYIGRSEETTAIKIIDIKALLQAIENEKSN